MPIGFSASSFWIVIATGVLDDVPDLPGFARMYGTSVHHCPFCDGWEHRDERLAVFAPTGHGIDLCRRLLTWSRRLVLFTHGWRGYRGAALAGLSKRGVRIVKLGQSLEGRGKQLERVRLEDGSAITCDALFFSTGVRASCAFAAQIGCRVSRKGIVCTDGRARAGPKRVYIVGDASATPSFSPSRSPKARRRPSQFRRSASAWRPDRNHLSVCHFVWFWRSLKYAEADTLRRLSFPSSDRAGVMAAAGCR